MISSSSRIIFLVILNLLLFGKSQETEREVGDFHGYLPSEDDKKFEYKIFQYPPHNYAFNEDYSDCAKNPMLPLLSKGFNLLLLKLGIFGIIKAIMALIFVAFLVKFPLLLLKVAFFKSFFLPLLVAPLFIHMFTNQMAQSSEGTMEEEKPSETIVEMPGIQAINEMASTVGRHLNDNLTSVAWQSMKMFMESDKCVEKLSCMIGASTKDSTVKSVFTRVLKYLHYSSPPSLQHRITLLREAFNKGSKTSTCRQEDFECHSPELMLQHGLKKIKIL